MHPIHFGLILVYNLCIGNITPPVGNALFVGIKVGRTTLAKVMPYMLMYYAAIILGLLLDHRKAALQQELAAEERRHGGI